MLKKKEIVPDNNGWIEINLPFTVTDDVFKEEPDLSAEAIEEGFYTQESYDMVFSQHSQYVEEAEDSISPDPKMTPVEHAWEMYEYVVDNFHHVMDIYVLEDTLKNYARYQKWLYAHPKTIAFQERINNTFTGKGLALSGTLIEIESTWGARETYLIGDVNQGGGMIGGELAFPANAKVVRYKKVWSPE